MTNTTIIANGTVLTCDAANHCGRLHIAVGNGRILAIAEHLDSLLKDHPDAGIVDAHNQLIVPGFINAHYHGESFLLRTLTAGVHFSLWGEDAHLARALEKLQHPSSYDDIRRLYCASSIAHLLSGTTCVGVFPLRLDENAFMHMLNGIEATPLKSVVALQNWDQIGKMQSLREKRPKISINVGEEHELTVYSIEKIVQAAKELRAPMLAHVGERKESVEIIRRNFQKDALSLLNSFNAFRQETILVHANHCSEEDVMMVKDAGGTVIVCPRATAAKQIGYPSLRHLAKRHVRIAIGTDWGNVDIIDEMRFMSQLPLVVPGLRMFSSLEILRMATINGAIALGLSHEQGSIESGKSADLVMFELNGLRLPVLPQSATAEALADIVVHHLSTGDISGVVVNGDFVIRNGKILGEIAKRAEEEFHLTYNKFFPQGLPSRTSDHLYEETKNVLPFSADVRSPQDEHEGFEDGFTVTRRKATVVGIDDTVPPSPSQPKPRRDPVKPELPSTVRRVFGEDDDT